MNANLIRGKIVEAGLTQGELALKIGISSNSLSRKLTGKREFRLDEVCKICEALNIDNPAPYFFATNIPNMQRYADKCD